MAARSKMPDARPLVSYRDELRTALSAEGYAPGTVAKYAGLLAQLSGWLAVEGLAPPELTEEMMARFVDARPALGYRTVVTVAGLSPLTRFLRDAGLLTRTAASRVGDPQAAVLAAFDGYLRRERRLAPLTVQTTVGVVRRFLIWLAAHDGEHLSRLRTCLRSPRRASPA